MRLSIITISFNAESCIKRTIESVLNQSKPVYEYIMIDGASQDRTYEIICSYSEEFKKRGIQFIHISEADRGISDAFNKGIARATGDLIGIINADDELMPETNRVLSEAWEKEKADIYYGNCWWVDTARHQEHIKRPKHNLEKLLYDMVLIHPSTFVTKTTYEECGSFSEGYKCCMDEEILYRFYLAGKKFRYVDAEFTKFKAGGVSDMHPRLACAEGAKMALSYGEPFLKVKATEIYKIIHNRAVNLLKDTPVYRMLKNCRDI